MIKTIIPAVLMMLALLFHQCSGDGDLNRSMSEYQSQLLVELATYQNNAQLKESVEIPLSEILGGKNTIDFNGGKWKIDIDIFNQENRNGVYKVYLQASLLEGESGNSSLGLIMINNNWSEDHYVLMPSAAYNGNRYYSVIKKRGVQLYDFIDCTPKMDPVITNIPRLNIKKGRSKLQILSGDMATPSIGYQSPSLQKGFFVLTDQGNNGFDYSYKIEETFHHDTSVFTIRVPGVREDSVYRGGSNPFYPSTDKGKDLHAGDELFLETNMYFFDADEIQDLFDYFVNVRKDVGEQEIQDQIPYSSAWHLQEYKYNTRSWVEKYGYYSVGMRENPYQDWQTGWTGGLNTVYPLYFNGTDSTRERVLETFEFLYDTISPSGFLYDVFHEGEWYFMDKSSFLRRNSDALFFIMKTYDLLEKEKPEFVVPEKWGKSAKKVADAYVELYNKYGHFGQWVSYLTGDITVGGTSGNAMACGALALCYERYNDTRYLETAVGAANYYYKNFVQKGMTNGGPGDNYQCPDSESAFAMLESFMVLYEVTGDNNWLERSREMANQCATWVVSYDFRFPEQSTFAKMDMKTTGTVYANVQNKHAAPGICSLSGGSLFRLYRYTGDTLYLDLIKDIMKTMPQYMSREDRPIPDVRPGMPVPVMPPGWINERVNMSDWEERGKPDNIRRGEIFGGSCWSETAFMLTYSEVPGLYILTDKSWVMALDNIEAAIVKETDDSLTIRLTNPTPFHASVRTIAESTTHQQNPLPAHYLLDARVIEVAGGETVEVEIGR